MKIKH